MTRLPLTGVTLLVVAGLCSPSAGQSPRAVDEVLEKATRYVVAYEKAFSLLVSEEHYVQEIQRPPTPGSNLTQTNPGGGMQGGAVTKRQELRSDYLLVQLGPGQGWMPFRDVFEVNGSKVRDREDRLAKLFLSNEATRFDQADRIMAESTRHNIGSVTRTINIPMLGMMLLHPRVRDRFAFDREGEDIVAGRSVQRVGYREKVRPTLIRTARGGDLVLQGRMWIEAATGTIVKTTLSAADTAVRADVTVTFRPDDALEIWVPAEMAEYYKETRSIHEIVATAKYSNVRRFQVKTTEKLGKPPGEADELRTKN